MRQKLSKNYVEDFQFSVARRQSLCKKQAPKNDVLNLESFVVREHNLVRHHICHLQPLMGAKDMTTITHHLVYESLV
jgi:hypothetical protein